MYVGIYKRTIISLQLSAHVYRNRTESATHSNSRNFLKHTRGKETMKQVKIKWREESYSLNHYNKFLVTYESLFLFFPFHFSLIELLPHGIDRLSQGTLCACAHFSPKINFSCWAKPVAMPKKIVCLKWNHGIIFTIQYFVFWRESD